MSSQQSKRKVITLKVDSDADIIKQAEKYDNFSDYVKQLIRKDISRGLLKQKRSIYDVARSKLDK